MSTPRIYIAVASFYPSVGGVQTQALVQGRSLRARGYEATIITFRYDKAWPSHEVVEGVPVIRVAGMLLGMREQCPRLLQRLLYFMAMAIMGWTVWCYRHRYDILHVYQLNLLVLPTAFVCRLTGKPMIIAVRCADSGKSTSSHASLIAGPLDPTLPWLHVSNYNRDSGDLEGLERMGKLIVSLTYSLLRRIRVIVVVLSSRMQLELAAHNVHLPAVQLIPNGVDTLRFMPEGQHSSDQHAQVVVCVSRLHYQKGIDVLLQAWYLLRKQLLPSSKAKLLIVGDGPIQQQLERMVEALDIAPDVEFRGVRSDIPTQFRQGTIAILPSRWEGMPNALLEAMACGLPCIATRVSGSEDIIQHEVNGLLVQSEDYQDMAQALLTLLNNTSLAQQYGRNARATVEERYSREHMINTYIALYQSITQHTVATIENTPSSEIYQIPY